MRQAAVDPAGREVVDACNRPLAHSANRLKGYSSRVLRQEFPSLRSRLPCLWSRSYYAGAVGAVSESVIRRGGNPSCRP
jgi:REP element-mobilizing transposase RayT